MGITDFCKNNEFGCAHFFLLQLLLIFIALRNVKTTLLSFAKVHFKSPDMSRYNYSYLEHSVIIGRKNKRGGKRTLKGRLLEALGSKEMSVFYKVHNFPVNSFKLINIFNTKKLWSLSSLSHYVQAERQRERKKIPFKICIFKKDLRDGNISQEMSNTNVHIIST